MASFGTPRVESKSLNKKEKEDSKTLKDSARRNMTSSCKWPID